MPKALFHILPMGTDLVRLFDPTRHSVTATSFRHFGPLLRFDHHLPTSNNPGLDNERGVYYSGFTLSSCIVEVFGDAGLINCGEWHVAAPRTERELILLDIRGSGAMRAGSVAALGKVPDHSISQSWSRWFYERPEYNNPDGLIWYNAHNDEDALVLFERAEKTLKCPSERVIRLDERLIRPILGQIAAVNNLIIMP